MDFMFVLVFSDGAISSKTSTCNHLAHLIKITDAGTRAMGYNEYGEQKTDCLVAGGKTHLAIQKNGTWYTYGLDLIKNIWEVFNSSGVIATTYRYEPYGAVTAEGDVIQPVQWSSEYYDSELDLVYYNYRHYNPNEGRWINRDPIGEVDDLNLYKFYQNNSIAIIDLWGFQGEHGYLEPTRVPIIGAPYPMEISPEWITALVNFGKWAKGILSPKTYYEESSMEVNSIKKYKYCQD